MKPALEKSAYFDSTYFQQEEAAFFHEWFFVGVADETPQNGDYKEISLYGKSYILQRQEQNFHLFFNICPHRFTRLLDKHECGSGKLKCPYHGWIFDGDGKAFVVEKNLFNSEEISDKNLAQLRTATCGKFIFATLSNPLSLEQFLGPSAEYMKEISAQMETLIDRNAMTIQANWKVVVENTLESYHLKAVHPESLAKYLSNQWEFSFEGKNSHTVEFLKEDQKKAILDARTKFFTTEGFSEYRQDLIFPNLTLATTCNTSFFVQGIFPNTAGECYFVSYGYLPPFKETCKAPVRKAYTESSVAFNRQIFAEDKVICERVQQGVTMAPFTGCLNQKEERVFHFQQQCRALQKDILR